MFKLGFLICFFLFFLLKKSGLIFKSPVATLPRCAHSAQQQLTAYVTQPSSRYVQAGRLHKGGMVRDAPWRKLGGIL